MPSKYVHTEVEGRKLKVSNLDKVIYPGIEVPKAEIIQYYLSIAPLLLKYIKGRPLTLIRFPDGIKNQQFYAKSKPKLTPEWVDSFGIAHSEETINYIVARDTATVVWLANLAALELHPMQMTADLADHPDHFIFDLDPPEDGDFEVVKAIAYRLKVFLENYGYTPYVKPSGSKGLHIFVPILTEYTHEEMVESVKMLAKIFVSQNKDTSTLAMSKEKRDGKTLIDIFRNHMAHTTVAPYSLRGKEGAPLSFPITWDNMGKLKHSKEIHIRNYKEWLDKDGDVWEDFYDRAAPLHNRNSISTIAPEVEEKLKDYIAKRDFNTTPEPGLAPVKSPGNQFCIQLHDAQNLHYDLRLEKDGVLLSWAIPKGLPHRKGVKRMAIQTEPHPMKYLDFEGEIPKGQYGAGKMWVWTRGTFEWIEQSEKKYKFKLVSPQYNRSFSMYRTRDAQWLVELIGDYDNENRLALPLKPMLAGISKKEPLGNNYLYEIKWDGIRTIIHLENDTIKIYSRSGRDITKQFPELLDSDDFYVESAIFDGEIVNLDDKGRPLFSNIISRMHTQGEVRISNVMKKHPAVCYLFDCLSLDGKDITKEPLIRRQEWLNTAIKKGKPYIMSEAISDGNGLWMATKQMDLEGIMAKNKDAPYAIGQRSDAWLKVKHRATEECVIAGYTKGEGDRSALFGALHLLKVKENGEFQYMGKVGTGFDSDKMKFLLQKFQAYIVESKPFLTKTDDDRSSVWMQPELRCEIQYASLASSGVYREPVFQRLVENEE